MLNALRESFRHFLAWLTRDEHRRKARQLRDEVEKAFTEHPGQTGETYPEHLWFTVRISLRFFWISFVLLTHGLFPFLFTRAASSQIERMYLLMKSRTARSAPPRPVSRIFGLRKNGEEPAPAPCIGIIGGGFSGTLVLANLIKTVEGPLTIEWFDEGDTLGAGVAYGTKDHCHLLNVRTGRMGAYADDAQGFFRWLHTGDGKESAAKLWPGETLAEDGFAPRALYGAYLRYILGEALKTAKDKAIDIHIAHAGVTDARLYSDETQQLLLSAAKGGITREVMVDALVLATGNLPPRHLSFQPGLVRGVAHYVADVWQPGEGCVFPDHVHQLPANSEIVIIGTGLTMVDSVLTLKKRGFKGTITAISRHGWLPASHAPASAYPQWEWTVNPSLAPQTALALLKGLRREIRRAETSGADWRSVIDSLRPVTQTLWKRLSTKERRRFLTRLFTLWNIHRHRMAPSIHAQLKAMQSEGVLKIIPGSIYYVGSDEEGLTVAYRRRGAHRVETIRAALVLNCTGPEYDIAASAHPLLRNMRDHALVTVGPLRMGIEMNASGSAKGQAADAIFPIGTLLVGELLECTAVPELREQAAGVALALAKRIRQLREGDNARDRLFGAWI